MNYELPLSVAQRLVSLNPGMSFVYVSGAGTDESEKGRIMWARVKGRTENALLRLPFQPAVMIRLAGLIPLKGFQSRTRLYRVFYVFLAPLLHLLAKTSPTLVTTPERLGRAMLKAARGEAGKARLEPADIHALGIS
jgi:hypothetical protein